MAEDKLVVIAAKISVAKEVARTTRRFRRGARATTINLGIDFTVAARCFSRPFFRKRIADVKCRGRRGAQHRRAGLYVARFLKNILKPTGMHGIAVTGTPPTALAALRSTMHRAAVR